MSWPIPPSEEQHDNIVDFQDCTSESAVHCIESQEIAQTGQTVGYSERALAKLSGNTPQGNTAQNVLDAIQKYGLIPESLWSSVPSPDMTWDDYYADIPQDILSQGVKVDVAMVLGANYSLSPVWTIMSIAGTENHAVCALDPVNYIDSYSPYQKQFSSEDKIFWQANLILNPKKKRMLVFFQVKGSATIWMLLDGQWVGFSDPTAFNNYVDGRPNVVIELDQSEFAKLQANPDVFKS